MPGGRGDPPTSWGATRCPAYSSTSPAARPRPAGARRPGGRGREGGHDGVGTVVGVLLAQDRVPRRRGARRPSRCGSPRRDPASPPKGTPARLSPTSRLRRPSGGVVRPQGVTVHRRVGERRVVRPRAHVSAQDPPDRPSRGDRLGRQGRALGAHRLARLLEAQAAARGRFTARSLQGALAREAPGPGPPLPRPRPAVRTSRAGGPGWRRRRVRRSSNPVWMRRSCRPPPPGGPPPRCRPGREGGGVEGVGDGHAAEPSSPRRRSVVTRRDSAAGRPGSSAG